MLRRVSVPRRWKFSVRYKSTNPHQSTSGLQSAFRARAVLQAIPAMDIRVAQLCNSDCTPAELKKTLLNYASPAYLKDVESINPNVAKTDLVNTARLVSELFITNMKGRGKQPPNVDIVLMVLKNLGKTEKRLVSKCLPEFVQVCFFLSCFLDFLISWFCCVLAPNLVLFTFPACTTIWNMQHS